LPSTNQNRTSVSLKFGSGKARPQQSGTDKRDDTAKPKPMVEQPEGGVKLASRQMTRKTNQEHERGGEQKGCEPQLPGEGEEERDDCEAGEPLSSSPPGGQAPESVKRVNCSDFVQGIVSPARQYQQIRLDQR
jgi:hypothetical protein